MKLESSPEIDLDDAVSLKKNFYNFKKPWISIKSKIKGVQSHIKYTKKITKLFRKETKTNVELNNFQTRKPRKINSETTKDSFEQQ